jgi:DNA-binding GntR family transcriptional regulator
VTSKSGRPKRTNLSSLVDQVYEYVRAAIIQGELQPNEKLVELNIAAQMGSSQSPVREALQRLERDGLVERQARSATFVSNIALDEMYELFFIRSTIEGFAIQRTAQRITPDQCNELVRLVQKMEQFGNQEDIFILAEYDLQFHRLIVEWSDSASLMHVWAPLSGQIQRFLVQSHPAYYPDFIDVGTRHQTIIDALRQHDAHQATKAIQEHIMLIWSRITP